MIEQYIAASVSTISLVKLLACKAKQVIQQAATLLLAEAHMLLACCCCRRSWFCSICTKAQF